MTSAARATGWLRAMPAVFVLIWISAVLTIWSMVYYLQKALPEIRARVR